MKLLIMILTVLSQQVSCIEKIDPDLYSKLPILKFCKPSVSQDSLDTINYVRQTLLEALTNLTDSMETEDGQTQSYSMRESVAEIMGKENPYIESKTRYDEWALKLHQVLFSILDETAENRGLNLIDPKSSDGEKVQEFYKTSLAELRKKWISYDPHYTPESEEDDEK